MPKLYWATIFNPVIVACFIKYIVFGWVGDAYQEQVEMHAEGWHYAHKQ